MYRLMDDDGLYLTYMSFRIVAIIFFLLSSLTDFLFNSLHIRDGKLTMS